MKMSLKRAAWSATFLSCIAFWTGVVLLLLNNAMT